MSFAAGSTACHPGNKNYAGGSLRVSKKRGNKPIPATAPLVEPPASKGAAPPSSDFAFGFPTLRTLDSKRSGAGHTEPPRTPREPSGEQEWPPLPPSAEKAAAKEKSPKLAERDLPGTGSPVMAKKTGGKDME